MRDPQRTGGWEGSERVAEGSCDCATVLPPPSRKRPLMAKLGWANGRYWRYTDLAGYRRSHRAAERYDAQQGMFL